MANPGRNRAATKNRAVAKAQPSPRSDFRFAHRLRVRWSEVDAQGIVFNPNYFVYADVGFTEYMRAVGLAYPQDLQRGRLRFVHRRRCGTVSRFGALR
jgi:hypothetical protein